MRFSVVYLLLLPQSAQKANLGYPYFLWFHAIDESLENFYWQKIKGSIKIHKKIIAGHLIAFFVDLKNTPDEEFRNCNQSKKDATQKNCFRRTLLIMAIQTT